MENASKVHGKVKMLVSLVSLILKSYSLSLRLSSKNKLRCSFSYYTHTTAHFCDSQKNPPSSRQMVSSAVDITWVSQFISVCTLSSWSLCQILQVEGSVASSRPLLFRCQSWALGCCICASNLLAINWGSQNFLLLFSWFAQGAYRTQRNIFTALL